ncbi:cytochrome P450 [Shimazuella sp. AN120528]|uniref:cytochrome P450 family protein n=1 Tax=Shimazuella soli TaxID=1892854 RepID=UPI001F0F4794|nr:cytochrome P450 [Shimazuella soli]MCH5586405.1 cytochrome P450 [Shimazuella soli]
MEKITSNDFISPEYMKDFAKFHEKIQFQEKALVPIDDFFGMGKAWLVHRYDDALSILKDKRFLKDMRKFQPQQIEEEKLQENTSVSVLVEWLKTMPNMLTVDPPDHTRLRRLVSKAFTPRMIDGLQPRIQEIADELLDKVMDKNTMDLIEDFAYPLPILVISEMLGIPKNDRNQFRGWTQKIEKASLDPKQAGMVAAALEDFIRYIKALINEKRKSPRDDVISSLIEAYEEGDKLSENELISTIWLLITAGHETTANLIANGMLALMQHPEQMNLLRHNPSLLSTAVEELLRYTGPVMIINRIAGEDIALHEQNIRKGDNIVISIASTNLDLNKFTHPDELNIARDEAEHLAFSTGIHHCLGAPLARLEGKIAFGTLLRRFPHLRLNTKIDQLHYQASTLRSLEKLPVTF